MKLHVSTTLYWDYYFYQFVNNSRSLVNGILNNKTFLFFIFFETKGWQANAKAQEAVDHLASFSAK